MCNIASFHVAILCNEIMRMALICLVDVIVRRKFQGNPLKMLEVKCL